MNKKAEPSVADDWLKIARKDWQRIGRNLRAHDLEAAAFFLQQSLEKYLKAFLLSHQNVLRDDGMSYGDYPSFLLRTVSEQLTYLLFLKMAEERTLRLSQGVPRGGKMALIGKGSL